MEREARYLHAFRQISKALNTTLSVEQRLKIMAQGVVLALGIRGSTIRLLDEECKTLVLAASCGLSDQYFEKGDVLPEKSVSDAMLGRVTLIKDARHDPRIQYPDAVEREGIVTILALPIKVRGEVKGMLKLHAAEMRDFSEEEIEFASSLAEQGGLAIENARLFEQKCQELQYLSAVTEVARAVGSTLEAPQILDLIVNKAMDVLGVKACTLGLLNPRTRRLELAHSHGLSLEYLQKGPLESDRSIASTAKGEVVWIEDAATDPRVQYPEWAKREGIAAILSVPMFLRDTVVGVLRLYCSRSRRFLDSQIEFVQCLAEFGALALQNASFYERSKTDSQAIVEGFYVFKEEAEGH
ncbi:MAG: GAF domain-containing protein [Syntrophobacteraceae bacterium]